MSEHIGTPYDDVFRTLLNDCSHLILPLLNEVFNENYTGKEKIIFGQNEHFMNMQDGRTEKRVSDCSFRVVKLDKATSEKMENRNIGKNYSLVNENGKTFLITPIKKYHLECESTSDGRVVLRFFEYDTQIALDDGKIEEDTLTVEFPLSAVIYLRSTQKTKDFLTVRMLTPGGEISYQIPIIKAGAYSIDEIFDKNLLFLIPFHIFSYEKDFEKYESDDALLAELKSNYIKIHNKLEDLQNQNLLSEYDKHAIIDMSKKVLENLARKYSHVKEEVKSIMGGKILDYEAKDILNKGIALGEELGIQKGLQQGILQGHNEGLKEALSSLVRDGLLSLSEAAKRAGMSEDALMAD